MEETFEREIDGKRIIGSHGLTIASVREFITTHRAEVLSACMLIVMAANMLTVLPRKSITNDELYHIPAGYYHLVAGFHQFNNEHPPLAKMWSALPLLFIQPTEPSAPKRTDEHNLFLTWGYLSRFWSDNKEGFRAIFFWTRVFMILVAVALGAAIFFYARRLFGARAALFAVALFALEPTILAHGRIVHTDIPAALVYLLFFVALDAYFRRGRKLKGALLVGLALGAALVTKFSMIVLAMVLGAVALLGFAFATRFGERRGRVALHAGMAFLVALFVINATYYFKRPPVTPPDVEWVKTQSPENFNALMKTFRTGSYVLPTYFMFGFYNVALHNRHGHPSSLLGMYSKEGWWYYFPVAFALKTTLPFLILTLAALGWGAWRLFARRDLRFLAVLAPLAVYLALSMSGRINIGIRHLLPAFPFLFIAAGALLDRLLSVKRARAGMIALVVLMFGWTTLSVWRAYPDYVPYMNELASKHPRWWYLSDSNVEWGDDAQELSAYLRARGETDVRGALSGGWGTLTLYGIAYHEVFPKPGRVIPETRYIAIGASFLNGSTNAVTPEGGRHLTEEERVNYLAEYRTRQPEAVFGGTIYLYRAH